VPKIFLYILCLSGVLRGFVITHLVIVVIRGFRRHGEQIGVAAV
jgi:hypothetical protein